MWSSFLAPSTQLFELCQYSPRNSRLECISANWITVFPRSKNISLTPNSSSTQFFHQINRLLLPHSMTSSLLQLSGDFHKLDFFPVLLFPSPFYVFLSFCLGSSLPTLSLSLTPLISTSLPQSFTQSDCLSLSFSLHKEVKMTNELQN